MQEGAEPLIIRISGTELALHPLKAVYMPSSGTLVCSDVHIGKAGHFRRHGIPVPARVNQSNFWNLAVLLDAFRPRNVLFLGDLMHSEVNPEWESFVDFLDQYPDTGRILVRGNHDIYPDGFYASAGFRVLEAWREGSLKLQHEPPTGTDNAHYTICGHLHPMAVLRGAARQRLSLPCFWFGPSTGVLPAFGAFTGGSRIRPVPGDQVYVTTGREVLQVG